MPLRCLAMTVSLLIASLTPAPAQALDDIGNWMPETVPPSPEELAPPVYAPPPRDAICGQLDGVLKKRLAKAERRKALQTRRSLHCPAAPATHAYQSAKRKHKSVE